MALQVWLPLTKDLTQQGLSNVTVTNSNATFNSAGKLGGCYSFNGSNSRIQISNAPTPTNISVALWFKRGANTNSRQFLYTQWSGITLELQADNTMICSVNTADGQSGYCKTSTTFTTSSDWVHVVFIFKNGTGTSLYINGSFVTSTAISKSISWNSTTGNLGYYSTYFNGSINDFRIYDHALSPKEVHELAKGLILHYPLSRGGFGQDNLLKNSTTNFPSAHNSATRNTQTGVSVPEWGCTDALRVYGTAGTTALCLLINNSTHGFTVAPTSVSGQKYTPSIYVKNNHSTNAIYFAFNGLASSVSVPAGTSKRVILAATGNGSQYLQFTISASAANAAYDFTFWHPKIELGEVATPWIPATTDTLYTGLGIGDGIEYDVSGNGYNGTQSGGITYTSDTPKYHVASSFDGTSGRITTPTLILPTTEKYSQMSFAFWMKRDDYADSKQRYMYNDICEIYIYPNDQYANNGYGLRVSWNHDTTSSSNLNTWATGLSIPANEWHHICIVFNGGVMRLYYDGVLYHTGDRSNTGQFLRSFNYRYIGRYVSGSTELFYGGLLSDFRIYATALSADDVFELYKAPISLANNGALMTNEFVEI